MRLTGRLPARDLLALGRFHAVALAGLSAALFDRAAGGLVAFDWFLLLLFNRISDVPEDRRNGVPGTEYVAQNAGALMRITFVTLAISLIGARPLGTPLLVLRCVFLAAGFAYSFPTVTRRLKEIFLVKNVVTALLFSASVLGYPLALGARPPLALCAFLLPLVVAVELICDVRDMEGDAAEGIVTLPVRWGRKRTRVLIELLLAVSAAALLAGYLLGAVRQLVLIAAPLQLAVVRRRTVAVAWIGALELLACVLWLR